MIDLRYHIASIVAVFLALGLGILIGTAIVGDDIFVDQQKKLLERLEEQFSLFKDREAQLLQDNTQKDEIISNYENYNQALLPFLVKERLAGEKLAVVVTGNTDIPSGLINTITMAGAEVVSKTVVLANISLSNPDIRSKLEDYYGLSSGDDLDEMVRSNIASSVAAVLLNNDDAGIIDFMQEHDLISFTGDFNILPTGVILVGGTNSLDNYFALSFDQGLIKHLLDQGMKTYGVERSTVEYSYMQDYQNNSITTIDNVDLSLGQISLVFAIQGEPGNYGIKPTAQKFMPSLPIQSLGSDKR